jgi:hypothetical protein
VRVLEQARAQPEKAGLARGMRVQAIEHRFQRRAECGDGVSGSSTSLKSATAARGCAGVETLDPRLVIVIQASEGKTLANRVGDLRALAFLTAGYAGIRLGHGAPDHLDYAKEAVRLADESGNVALRRVVRWAVVRSLLFAGHLSAGLTSAEEGMDRLSQEQTVGTELLGFNPYTMLAAIRANFLFMTGRVAERIHWFEKAIQRAREDTSLCSASRAQISVPTIRRWVARSHLRMRNKG